MSRMERIMGIPQDTKKPSSLKNPRDQPPPRYINKQGAIDIARKLKLTKIGKVGLRITNSTSIDSEMRSKFNNTDQGKEMSQKSLMDRRKGLEMARNIVESRVGKCIMETNDYEVRRFNREFEKLLEDEDQTKRQMMQKKREFVNHKQKVEQAKNLTRRDGSRSPRIPTTSDMDRPHLPNIYPTGALQQHTRDHYAGDEPRAESRGRSPGYMRPLSCTRDKSHDSAVGETERFLNSPYMRACISNINDEEATNRVLEGIQEANDVGSRKDTPPKSRAASAKNERTMEAGDLSLGNLDTSGDVKRPVSRGAPLSKLLLTKKLNDIKETSESRQSSRQQSPVPPKPESAIDSGRPTGNTNDVVDTQAHLSNSMNGAKPGDAGRGKFLVELIKSESFSNPMNPESPVILVESFRADGEGSITPSGSKKQHFASIAKRLNAGKDDGGESSDDGNKKQKKLSANSLTVAAQVALLRTRTSSRKKRRAAKKIANMNARALQLSDRADLMKDPRFTCLTSSLIPESSGSTDLYHSKGQFSMPEHVANGFKSNASRTKDSKFRQSRNLQNLTRFEDLLNSI